MLNYVQVTIEEYMERLGLLETKKVKTEEKEPVKITKVYAKKPVYKSTLLNKLNNERKEGRNKHAILSLEDLKDKKIKPASNKKKLSKKEFKQLEAETITADDITVVGKYMSNKGEPVYYAYTKDYYIVWNSVAYDVPLRRRRDSEQFRRVRNYDFAVEFYKACMEHFPNFCDDIVC